MSRSSTVEDVPIVVLSPGEIVTLDQLLTESGNFVHCICLCCIESTYIPCESFVDIEVVIFNHVINYPVNEPCWRHRA